MNLPNRFDAVPLAITGIGLRLPGADGLDSYWELLRSGRHAIAALPASRLNRERYYQPGAASPGKTYSQIGGTVPDEELDPTGLALSESELRAADPAHLWFLRTALAALRHAGIDPDQLAGQRLGIFVGHARGSTLAADLTYAASIESLVAALLSAPEIAALPAAQREQLATRLVDDTHARYPSLNEDGGPFFQPSAAAALAARRLKTTGPYMAVDAACASSFAALDIAARAIHAGEIEAALVGGCSYNQWSSLVLFSQAQALSPNGSFPFDERADGFVSSDGHAALVLEPLERARVAGRTPLAILRSIGGSCDGRGKSLWAPLKEGQVEAIARAYRDGLSPESVQVIEAHATGTAVGDATEISALSEIYGRGPGGDRAKRPIASVKANIGHTRETAGMAGLIKMILALHKGVVPPAASLQVPSSRIDWDAVPFRLPRAAEPWPDVPGQPRRAAVNAFGIGGLNYHVVLELPEATPAPLPRVEAAPIPREPIALVGAGAVLPGAADLAALLQLVAQPTAPTLPEPSRWEAELYADAAGGPYRIRQPSGHFLRGWQFDWRRHKIPPRQVEHSDPLQFMLLEAAAQALRQAGWEPGALPHALRTAVYVGSIFGGDFTSRLNIGMRLPELEEDLRALLRGQGLSDAAVGELLAAGRRTALERFPIDDQAGSFSSSTLASRIAKHFDLSGPCCALDAEEASGLSALASALDALRAGTCDVALCCAGQRLMHHTRFAHYERLGKLARPGHRGFLLAEGAVVLTLRRLSDAERDGQPILAVLHEARGAASPDGPWPALREAVRGARERASLRPRLIETFARGVEGDEAIEQQILQQGYADTDGAAPPTQVSATPDLGMAQGASGLVGLLHLAATAAAPASTRTPAALDSIGLRGLAYHALLEVGALLPSPAAEATTAPTRPPLAEPVRGDELPDGVRIIRLAAASREALREQIAASDASRLWEASAASRPFPADAAWRLAVVASSPAALRTKLVLAREAQDAVTAWPGLHEQGVFLHRRPESPPELALVFSGQGSQYGGMLKELCQRAPQTRPVLDEIDQVLAELGEPRFADVIWQPEREALLGTDTWTTQLAVLGADLLVHSALQPLGLRPALVLGHSYGEYPALCAAGAWSLRTALRATHARCQALAALGPPPGRLISTNASEAQAAALQQRFLGRGFVAAANYNSPEQLVLAVENAIVDEVLGALAEDGVIAQLLPVPQPYHSQLLAPAQPALERALATLPLRPPRTPLLSGVGNSYAADPDDIRRRLVAQLTEPLRFTGLVRRAYADGIRVFIEVGPRTVLTRLIRSALQGEPVLALCTDHPKVPAAEQLARVRALLETQDLWQPARPSAAPEPLTSAGGPPRIVPYARTRQLPEPAALPIPHFDATAKRRSKQKSQANNTPVHEPELAVQNEEAAAPGAPAGEPLGEMERFLIRFVCEQTGYPAEVVGLDQDLEADLGIDSIKRAQMLGELKDQFRLKLPVSGSGGLSLAKLVTLRDVSRLLKEYAPDATGPGPAPSPLAAAAPAASAAAPVETVRPVEPLEIVRLRRFAGSRFELGRQHGAAFAAEIERSLRRYRELLGENVLELEPVKAFLARQHEFFDEPSLEELRGIAAGSGLPFQRIVAYNLGLEPEHGLFGCSQIAIRAAANHGAGLLHAANEDSPIALRLGNQLGRFVQVRRPAPEDARARHAVCVFSSPGQLGGINGLSDAGLVVSSTMLLDQPRDLAAVGAVHPSLVLRILEEADDLEQALAIVRAWPRLGAWSLLLSHAPTDRIVYLEYDGPRLAIEEVADAVCTTNHSRLLGASEPPEHSLHRLARLSTLRATSPLRAEAVQAMLRDRTDLGRGRVVAHCTMNTVCRVDNQLSFVYTRDAATEKLWATPGPERSELADRFVALPPADLFGVATAQGTPANETRLMHRYILRTEAEPASPGGAAASELPPRRTLLVAGGSRELAELLTRALTEAGSEVRTVAEPEQAALAAGGWLPQRLILLTALDGPALPAGGAGERAAWLRRNGTALLLLVQRWVVALRGAGSLAGAELYALTALGGDLGFGATRESLPTGGALCGLLKALRREMPELRIKLVDTPVGEPAALRCRSLLAELAAGAEGGPLEVGVVRGRRQRVRMIRRELPEAIEPAAASRLGQALTPQAAWLVTGGGRGITSLCARALGERFGVSLHLVGSTPYEEVPAPWTELDAAGLRGLRQEIVAKARQQGRPPHEAWQKVERRIALSATLKGLAAAGLRFRYHQADLGDEAALGRVLAAVRAEGLPLRGILHGAGTESASELAKKTEAQVASALGSKVLGLLHLLALTAEDPIEAIVGFGSVSGRFGGLGQADYSLASDLLAKVLGAHRRATGIASTTFAWPAWGDVGMAMRPESRIALESVGQAFMPAAEGIEHLVRELGAGLPESEIVLLDRPELLDGDRTALPDAGPALREANEQAAGWAVLEAVIDVRPGGLVAECLFDPRRDVFLLEHQFEGAPILPAVIGLEALAEAALLDRAPRIAFEVEDARIHSGLRFLTARPLRAQVVVQGSTQDPAAGRIARLVADHFGKGGGLGEPGRLFVAARLHTAPVGPAPDELSPPDDLSWQPMRYLDGPNAGAGADARRVYHGPALRTLVRLGGQGEQAFGELVAPAASLRPERPGAHFRLPAALLDGCLVACGAFARTRLGVLSLPDGFERLVVQRLPREGERCRLHLVLLSREELHLRFRFTLRDEAGEPLLWAEGYRAVVVADLSRSSDAA
ncbi:MAG: C45 family autoproteolytic acyltransferase/hydrolase [Polyangia bacterium]